MPRATSIRDELARLRAAGLERRQRVQQAAQQPHGRLDGRAILSFCSNDYLGLANHPELVAALQHGAARWGVGSGSAHLVSGHSAAHQQLEEELAEFLGRERALLFSTGYMANLGVVSTFSGRGELVLQDRLNHASLIDGAILARATLRRYAHADAAALAQLCERRRAADDSPVLIATDSVFSMDGDLAPLPQLATIARDYGAWLLVDEAHGFGVLGRAGRGGCAHCGLDAAAVPLLMGTLGKACGTHGAFVAGPAELIELMIQRARSYIYTTATPPALAEATRVALRLLAREDWRRTHLAALIARLRAGAAQLELPLLASDTPIQPLLAGSDTRALAWSQALEEAGILVAAIRAPTVPPGSARLRITLSAAHSEADVDRLLDTLARLPRTPD